MGTTVTVLVPPQHPAFEGHFPGAPLLPGVVLLDEVLRVVEEARFGGGDGATAAAGTTGVAAGVGSDAGTTGVAADVGSDAGRTGAATGWTISTAKFLQPVRPGDTLTVEHEALANGAVRFAIRSGGRAVATGTLVPRLEVTERDHGHQAR
jgi:3-hydroxymyristoyl/3-hydroxydecanoyl-(acyl carrier protein) dehydratase